ncbi:MAG TPA: LysR substrate-binding domain-containing protein [Bordetella sp.]
MAYSKHSLARRLKLQQLAIFESVLACGSMLAASRELHMTQPALSKAIQELEEHFGQPLLIRTRRGVQPTDFGLMLRNHSQSLMTELRSLADELNAWNSSETWDAEVSGHVAVGSLLAASAHLLPQAVLRLRETTPNVSVQVRVGVNDKMFPELVRGELDVMVGLMPDHADDPVFEHVKLYDETLCVVAGRQHPLATSQNIDPARFEAVDWILPTPDTEAMHAVDALFAELGFRKPARIVESVSIMTNLGLLVESRMIAVMPFSVARKFVHLGVLSILPLGREIPFGPIGYTVPRGRPASPAVQRFLMALKDVAVE